MVIPVAMLLMISIPLQLLIYYFLVHKDNFFCAQMVSEGKISSDLLSNKESLDARARLLEYERNTAQADVKVGNIAIRQLKYLGLTLYLITRKRPYTESYTFVIL